MFTVYALFNKENNRIYIGQTINLEARLNAHREKLFRKSFTAKTKGEWFLIYKESVQTRIEAIKREKQLKSYRGREFVKGFIPR